MLRKLIGTKDFYRRVILLALPIMIQNGITNFVNMLDNIMVGRIGSVEMTGVAVANQLLFVFNLCIFGAVSGAGGRIGTKSPERRFREIQHRRSVVPDKTASKKTAK